MKLIARVLLCTLTLIIATVVSGALIGALHLKPPVVGWSTTPAAMLAWMSLGSLVLIVGLMPIALGIGGSFSVRCFALVMLLFLANAVNQVLELSIFSTIGGFGFLLAQYIIAFFLTAAALAWAFGAHDAVPSLPRMPFSSWTWRVLAAWLAFPVIYLAFGMCVGPFVVPYYKTGVLGLIIPPLDVIMRMQLLRSFLFLVASLPVILLWTGSRRRLIFALGLAHSSLVGLYGLSQAYWMPSILRELHSIEIVADSFVYALVVAWLFFPRTRMVATSSVTHAPVGSASAA